MTRLSGPSIVIVSVLASLSLQALDAQPNVLTYHNDAARTGADTNETVLTPSNVNSSSFGELFSHSIDGYVYSQPLYMAGVPINGSGRHNVVFVATEGDSIYAFDADAATGPNAQPLWKISFANGSTVVPISASWPYNGTDDVNCFSVNPQIGITSTPVIDPVSMTLYAVTAAKEISGASTNWVHRVRAVDITTGLEKAGSGLALSAPAGVAYNPKYMIQRAGLLLLSGNLYIGFASVCDTRPYNGLLLSVNVATMQQNYSLVASPGDAGGIWGSGGAPAVDSLGNIYVAVGNGNFDPASASYGGTLLKLNPQLQVQDYFASDDVLTLASAWDDKDLGASMPILLPDSAGSIAHPHLMVIGGKEGVLYLVDRDNLEQFESPGNPLLPSVPLYLNSSSGLFGKGAYFNGQIYLSPGYTNIQSFSVVNASMLPAQQTPETYGPWTGASLGISANGLTQGLLWVLSSGNGSVLEAYDAANLRNGPLYNNVASGDTAGMAIGNRFGVPTIAQGKVYVTSGADNINGSIAAFGLKSPVCAADVSSQVLVARGGWKFNRATGIYSEAVTLTNTGLAPLGALSLVLDSLSSFSQLTSGSGTTTCGAITGSFYQNVPIAALGPGQSATVNITVTNSSNQTITFNTRVLSGSGIH